ncbi:MAG TPA: hypothetical protein VEB18_03635 [Candidatus Paceibacterota bacterium]|nr:hypothetical protein [Candidatus Paceibacterota bacterium]
MAKATAVEQKQFADEPILKWLVTALTAVGVLFLFGSFFVFTGDTPIEQHAQDVVLGSGQIALGVAMMTIMGFLRTDLRKQIFPWAITLAITAFGAYHLITSVPHLLAS